ncbi:hypothetical protein, variant [Blastomyces gilchristii SLH14081]|uniref:Uncharacterized protein n=1 Tax=Blastomyces gilchristii (strain SLH14081) TaxID=559298 RepID=A0A179UMC6_BLAGS|nr:uncharacterized protein BDBG_17181 [Blastomyces gilchristii SLH14081]XP_031578717.1 hypothetical protein, variant [Blastomyces gilchristii SLH14081]OAT09235.1 hypothetical protein BDBG_17181 [Blastomyces gilchristii SLH14081]OAT09236.1 hypothetical protein, variant [Blastomyces gilchristii SLH14081]
MPLTNKPDAPAVSLGEGGDVGLPPITNNLREQFGRILIDKNPLFEYRLARQYRLDLLLCADAGVKRLAELRILWRGVLFKRKSVGRTRRTNNNPHRRQAMARRCRSRPWQYHC